MIHKLVLASICTACILSATPGEAAQRKADQMPEGKRDTAAMDYTKHQVTMQKKENKEANSNVDRLIDNRR